MSKTAPEREIIEDADPDNLLEAVNRLARHTRGLTTTVTLSAQQARRTRMLTWAVIAFIVGVLVFGAIQWSRVTSAIEGNQDNAVQSCENANETRAANRSLWNYILTLSGRDAEPGSVEAQTLDEFKAWIEVLYQPHDCNDLGREYVIPDPPSLVPPAA